ncbi:MAG TPA: hypothetical protein VGZ22_24495 [Isosphaeraceae bacterium]|nr:hypothetical protein [Isosphaeraceae bacterium]
MLPRSRDHGQAAALSAPEAPRDVEGTGLDRAILSDLALKVAYTVPQLTTGWAAQRLHLPLSIVGELLEQLRADHLLDILGQSGPFGFRYAISQKGRDRSHRLMEISGYVGPAPVSLSSYTAMLESQMDQYPQVSPEVVEESIAPLVLERQASQLAGLAISSGRSLFVYGPPGNGKTSLGRLLHNAMAGDIWIPYCISVDGTVIRLYDTAWHQLSSLPGENSTAIDQRWVHIRRPMIVGGGELTIENFDLNYNSILRYYEAPLHLKANGGMFLIDDFGRQRVEPRELMNRWIIPLEHRIDHLTLHTGSSIQVPYRQMLIIATNLDPATVMDQAFLRRMGYRLRLDKPTVQDYVRIFERYAANVGAPIHPGVVDRLMNRYGGEQRDLRCCEPRDLIERVRDICRFRNLSLELTHEHLDLAWMGYFGNTGPT